jgi:hypothetical protein
VIVGLLFAVFFCAVTPYNDFKVAATYLAGTQFPIGALFVLFVLSGSVNPVLRRWNPGRTFRTGELLTIWTLILVASGLPSSGMMRYFLPMIVYPHYISDDKNNYESRVWHGIPNYLKVTDHDAAVAFFKGYPRGDEHVPWAAWAGPLFFWGILAALFLLASFSIASLLRRQWVENEKFSFPLVTLPLLLSEDPAPGGRTSPILCAPLLWVGFIAVTVLHTVNGVHLLYPALPDIPTRWNLMDFLRTRPWDGIGPIDAVFYPLVIGISYLLSSEVCFSLWFFHLFYKMELLLGVVQNWDLPGPVGGFSYKQFHGIEAFGGGVALLIWTAWTSRRHLSDVWAKAIGSPGAAEIDDRREMMSYRATLFGLFVSYAGIAAWLGAAGVGAPLILLSLLTMTLALVVISWVVCQAGMLFMAQPYGSIDIIATTVGTAPFPLASLYTVMRFEGGLFYDTREMLAPSLLMGAKSLESSGPGEVRALFRAMAVSVALGAIVSTVASLMLPYYNGGGNSLSNPFMYRVAPGRPLTFLAGAASVPFKGSWTNLLHILGGFAGVLGLLALRAQVGWGLHPIGFLCASVYAMHELWFSIFLAWCAKTLIQRYGGMRGYKGALPLFMGFVLGDVVNAIVWILLGYATGVGYQITPN